MGILGFGKKKKAGKRGPTRRERWRRKLGTEAGKEVVMHVIIWLCFGAAINLLPLLTAYMAQPSGVGNLVNKSVQAGDLLISSIAMLSPALVDLAIKADTARRVRIGFTLGGVSVVVISLLTYAFAQVNAASHGLLAHMSFDFVLGISVISFSLAALVGSVCTGFLAAESRGSDNGGVKRIPSPRKAGDKVGKQA